MKQTTVLYRTYETALAARKAYADAVANGPGIDRLPWFAAVEMGGSGTLGCDISTPVAYVTDLWELWGDGRRIVSAAERSLLLASLLEGHARFPFSLGSVRLFARFAGYQAGGELFEEMVAVPDDERARRYGLTAAENDAFSLVRAYYAKLSDLGAIELGCAAATLRDAVPAEGVIVAEALDAAPAVRAFIESVTVRSFAEEASGRATASGCSPLFAFPAGMGAVQKSVLSLIADRLTGENRILVAASDARALFASCAPGLARDGFETALVCSVPFDETAFGRALHAVEKIVAGDAHIVFLATDFAYGAFSGMTPVEARKLNSRLRGNRGLDMEGIRRLLRESSRTYEAWEALVRTEVASDEEVAALLRRTLADATGLAADERLAEEKALDAFFALRKTARDLGISSSSAQEQARGLRVPLSLASASHGPQERFVRFIGTDALGSVAPHEFDAVILVGLTDAETNTASEHSTLDTLAQRLGLPLYPSRVERLRRDFACAQQGAEHAFACVMPLRDDAFEPTYPAFTLDEYVDALARAEGVSDDRRDDDFFRFPEALVESASRFGEDDLPSSVGDRSAQVTEEVVLEPVVRGLLKYTNMLDSLKTVDEAGATLPVLSPSAIETYLSCPYRWFAGNRLRLNQPDETFSAREMGLFAHRAFAETYEWLAEEGSGRIDEENLGRAHAVLDEAMDTVLAEYEATRGELFDDGRVPDRLLPMTPAEGLEVDALRETLHGSLTLMAHLPQDFEVLEHEFAIKPEDGIDFAGARVNGRIDRIDIVPDDDRFAIIDYKRSLKGYEAGWSEGDSEDDFALPAKVQALIYALAFQRLHGGRPSAAVYASYCADKTESLLAGSFDPVAYGASAVSTDSSIVWKDFATYLEVVEEGIAPAIENLKQGVIVTEAVDAHTCKYCPLEDCERRR